MSWYPWSYSDQLNKDAIIMPEVLSEYKTSLLQRWTHNQRQGTLQLSPSKILLCLSVNAEKNTPWRWSQLSSNKSLTPKTFHHQLLIKSLITPINHTGWLMAYTVFDCFLTSVRCHLFQTPKSPDKSHPNWFIRFVNVQCDTITRELLLRQTNHIP